MFATLAKDALERIMVDLPSTFHGKIQIITTGGIKIGQSVYDRCNVDAEMEFGRHATYRIVPRAYETSDCDLSAGNDRCKIIANTSAVAVDMSAGEGHDHCIITEPEPDSNSQACCCVVQ